MIKYPEKATFAELHEFCEANEIDYDVGRNNMGVKILVMSAEDPNRTVLYTQEFGVGDLNKLEVGASPLQIMTYFHSRELIQVALPSLTPDEREFILSGVLPGGYDAMMTEVDSL